MTFAEENTKKGQGATCDEVIQKHDALLGTNDDLEGTYGSREGNERQDLQPLGEELLGRGLRPREVRRSLATAWRRG